MITDLAAFSGMEMENMTRGHGWRFLDIGRRLERAMNATSLVRQALSAGPSDNAVLEPLLEIADSSMTYRRRYFARPQLAPVLDLLLLDDTNTRAAGVSAGRRVGAHSTPAARPQGAVADARGTADRSGAWRRCGRWIRTRSIATGDEGAREVTALLGSIEDDLRALSDTITYFYFSHAELRVS